MNIEWERNFSELPPHIRDKINNANVFYSENYRDYLAQDGSKVLFLYDDNYVIMATLTSKYIFRFARFPSEKVNLNDEPISESESEFLDKCINSLVVDHKIQWMLLTPASSFFISFPQNSIRIPFGNYVIDLSQTEDEIFSKFDRKNRTSVRRAEKADVIIKFGGQEYLEDFVALDKETWERSGRAEDNYFYFQNILNTLKENVCVVMAYKDDLPQGGAIFYYNQIMSYCMFAVSRNQPEVGSMNLLHWETIKFMKGLSVLRYSFVGARINEDVNSKYHGIQRFKKNFGGELVTGYLFKSVFNSNLYRLYCWLVKIKSPDHIYTDIIDEEVHKWPHLQMGFVGEV